MAADETGRVSIELLLREDIYRSLQRRGGNLSDVINETLANGLKTDGSMFGSIPPTSHEDVRDHLDRV
ncbi:MAG TPA: hypothetical protein VM370_04635 [Candidatus Thermoplasmatota archaeon]|nr:hypothetical protein [Candidatus Thermoplasmatota archaeon]